MKHSSLLYELTNSYLSPLMKMLFCIACCFLFCFRSKTFSQTITPGLAPEFGIDGNVLTNQRLNGTFTEAGSHGWFKKTGGPGYGLIDTTGAATLRQQMLAGSHSAFSRRMQYLRSAVQDNVVMMDGCYARYQ